MTGRRCEGAGDGRGNVKDTDHPKYEQMGAYHWRQTDPDPHNAAFNPPLAARYQAISQSVPPATRMLLDAGCGDGYLLYCIGRTRPGARMHGIDLLETAIRLARSELAARHCRACLHTASVGEMPFRAAVFDTVCMADVIEHLNDPGQALAESRRVLKPGGTLLLSTPNRQPDRMWDTLHVREFAADELAALCGNYFPRVSIVACWPMAVFRAWRRNALLRSAMNLLARRGCNLFLWRTARPSPAYGQLIARCVA